MPEDDTMFLQKISCIFLREDTRAVLVLVTLRRFLFYSCSSTSATFGFLTKDTNASITHTKHHVAQIFKSE